MTLLYGALKDNKPLYQTPEMEKAQYVATKENADFVRVYIYEGAELTTFNLEPSTLEETSEYINRLVATINHIKTEYDEVRNDLASSVAQHHHTKRIVEKLRDVVGALPLNDGLKHQLMREANAV